MIVHQLNIHPASNAVLFQCSKCPLFFYCKEYLTRHERNVHTEAKLECHLCGSLFKLQYQLKEHLKRHVNRIYQCELCDKNYPRQIDLNIHMRTHTGEKPFKCSDCEQRFSTATRRSVHFAARHAIEKTKCPHCGLVFEGGKTSRYYSHVNMHNGIGMPYKCEMCDSELNSRYQ